MRKWRQLCVVLAVLGASLFLATAPTDAARDTRSSSGGSTRRRLAAVDAVDAADAELSADALAAGAGMSRLPFGTCSSDSRRTSWGMTLKHLTPRQSFLPAGSGSSGSVPILRQCFDIDRANQCSGDGGEANPCCDPSRSPTRLALRVDLAACGVDSLRGLEWMLDGRPLRFSIVRPGFLVFQRLGAWQQAATTRELCVSIPQDAANLAKCQTLKQLCVGRSTCKYRLFGAVDAAGHTLSSLQGTGTATSSCCFEGYTLDESLYGAGEGLPVEPPQLQSTQSLGQGFSKLLAAAAQLREAVKKGDPAAAAAAMQISYSEAPGFSAEAVLLQAEVPAELNATAWNSAVKSQGTSTMASSYAAVAAAEAAFIALNSVGDAPAANLNVNFSEKALHWCDSPSPAAWDGRSVLATLADKGAVAASCFGDAVGYEYAAAEVGKLGGSCREVLGKCERWKGEVEAADLTPVGVADFRRLQEHVQKYHAAVAQIVMFSDMEQQLQVRQARDGDVWLNPEGAGSVAVSAGEGAAGVTKRFVHFVVITGWNFSSPDPKEHFWIVKDSLSGLGIGQYWKLGTQSPVGLGTWIGGFVKPGTANSTSSSGTGGSSSPVKSGGAPVTPTPTPVQHSSATTGTAIPTQPLAAGPAADSNSGGGSGDGKAETPNKELPPVVIPGQPPVPARNDINTVTDVPFGADLPNFMAAKPTPPEASTAPAASTVPAASTAPADGNETAANGGDGGGGGGAAAAGPAAVVGPAAATDVPAAATAGPAASVPDTPADAAGSKPAAGTDGAGTGPALGPVDACATYTTSQPCETLSEAWEKRGGSAVLVPLQASFVDNFFVLRGQDIACLRPGTQLKLCSADSGAAAFSMLKDLGRR